MTISAQASQAAAAYLSELGTQFITEVVEELREQIIEMDQDPADRTADLFALLENHDVANEPRTWLAFSNEIRKQTGYWAPDAV
jgi:hypothetical protein